MPYDEILAKRVGQLMSRHRGLEEKKMFGGIGFLLRGNMCCGAWKEFLILRLRPERAEEALEEPHTRPFDITGRAMRGWVMVEPVGWREPQLLADWVRQATRFTESLPPKVAKKAKPSVKKKKKVS